MIHTIITPYLIEQGNAPELAVKMASREPSPPEAESEAEVPFLISIMRKPTTKGVHDLLKPAQDEIKAQLRRLKERLSIETREAATALQAVKATRVDLGDQLSKLQAAQERISQKMVEAEDTLEGVQMLQHEASVKLTTLQRNAEIESAATRQKRAKINSLQLQLRKATEILHQVEMAQSKEASDLAATKRAAYVAEDFVELQLQENGKESALIGLLRSNLQRLNEFAAADHQAAENARKRQEAKEIEVRAVEALVANLRSEAATLEKKWEEEMRQLRKLDEVLHDKTKEREDIEGKCAAALAEASKLRSAATKEAERNWLLGQNFNKTVAREAKAREDNSMYDIRARKAVADEQLAVAQLAVASSKLAQFSAAKREQERNAEDLKRQHLRVVQECVALQNRLDSLLEDHADADGAISACRNELKISAAAAIQRTSQIQSLEESVLKLQKGLEKSQDVFESLAVELEHAERDVAAATARLNSMQQEVNGTLKSIEQRTREVQILDNKRGKMAECANKEDAGT